MDGMDGRGQVIVIGATNRPDSVDPALRRPGRFDREFYFPLPSKDARRKILDIQTNGWPDNLDPSLMEELAEITKGYGGADLRALCTEAFLNAVKRTYPQIYQSNEKLLIDPEKIKVGGRDFMLAVKNIVPSSERSASSGAKPLEKSVEPLLRQPLKDIKGILEEILPRNKKTDALEEAQFADAFGDYDAYREHIIQKLERDSIYRPRLLIRGPRGLGHQYLGQALLHHFEGFHVQSFDSSVLLGDSGQSAEATVKQLFTEVRRHQPSVIFIPHLESWYEDIGETARSVFRNLYLSIDPHAPILLLGLLESRSAQDEASQLENAIVRELFGSSARSKFDLAVPDHAARMEYFKQVVEVINLSPEQFPDPVNRKKRVLEKLPLAPPEAPTAPKPLTKEQLKRQRKEDRYTLASLKRLIQPVMDLIKQKHKKFRNGVIEDAAIGYLFDEADPTVIVRSDMPEEQRDDIQSRPFKKATDETGEEGLLDKRTNQFFYNMETVTIEKRLQNGYYKRPRDFLADIKKLTKDARAIGDEERLMKANELQSNVEVDMRDLEVLHAPLVAECEAVYRREKEREREAIANVKRAAEAAGRPAPAFVSNMPPPSLDSNKSQTTVTEGAIVLGAPQTNGLHQRFVGGPAPVTSAPSSSAPAVMSSGHGTLTNGISDLSNLQPQSNGTSVPSRPQGSNGENVTPIAERIPQPSESFGQSAQTRPAHMHTGGPLSLQQRLSQPGSLSQRSVITPLAPGADPSMYENSASTTSSDKRNTLESTGPVFTQPGGLQMAQAQLQRVPEEEGAAARTSQKSSGSQKSSQKSTQGHDVSMLLDYVESNASLPDTEESELRYPSLPRSLLPFEY